MDCVDRSALSRRSRRHKPLAGAADYAPDADLGSIKLDRDHETPANILCADALARVGDDRRICLARSAVVLSFLRSVAGADVLPDWNLGRRAAHLRVSQILYLYSGRIPFDAGRHHRDLFHSSTSDRCGDV